MASGSKHRLAKDGAKNVGLKKKINCLMEQHERKKKEAWEAQVVRPATVASQCMIAAISMAKNKEVIAAGDVQESIERHVKLDVERAGELVKEGKGEWAAEALASLGWWSSDLEKMARQRCGGRKGWNQKEGVWDGAFKPSDIVFYCGEKSRMGEHCGFMWKKRSKDLKLVPVTREEREVLAGRAFVLVGVARKSTDSLSKKVEEKYKASVDLWTARPVRDFRNSRSLHAIALRFDEEGLGWLLDTGKKSAIGCTVANLKGKFLKELVEVWEV